MRRILNGVLFIFYRIYLPPLKIQTSKKALTYKLLDTVVYSGNPLDNVPHRKADGSIFPPGAKESDIELRIVPVTA